MAAVAAADGVGTEGRGSRDGGGLGPSRHVVCRESPLLLLLTVWDKGGVSSSGARELCCTARVRP